MASRTSPKLHTIRKENVAVETAVSMTTIRRIGFLSGKRPATTALPQRRCMRPRELLRLQVVGLDTEDLSVVGSNNVAAQYDS